MAVSGVLDDWRHEATVGAGSVTDYTGKVISIDTNVEKPAIDSTVFGNAARQYERGLEDFEVNVTYKYDDTFHTLITTIYNHATGDVDCEYSPGGTGSGAVKISANMKIFSIGKTAEIDGLKTFTVNYKSADGNGATFSTH